MGKQVKLNSSRGGNGRKKGATEWRRVYDVFRALQGLPYGGYISLLDLYPRLRGYSKFTIGDTVRAVDEYMRLQGHHSWCRADGQEGFWLGESKEELREITAAEAKKKRAEEAKPKLKPPSGKPYLATVKRAREWILAQPGECIHLPRVSIQQVYGAKKIQEHQWCEFLDTVLNAKKLIKWTKDGAGGVIQKPGVYT